MIDSRLSVTNLCSQELTPDDGEHRRFDEILAVHDQVDQFPSIVLVEEDVEEGEVPAFDRLHSEVFGGKEFDAVVLASEAHVLGVAVLL